VTARLLTALLLVPALLPGEARAQDSTIKDRAACARAGGRWGSDSMALGCTLRGARQGLWTSRPASGKRWERTYLKDVLHGPARDYYRSCGKALEGQYSQGKRAGKWTLYYPSGVKAA